MSDLARKLEALFQFAADQQEREAVRQPRRERPRCGARTREGNPCKAPVVWLRGELTPRKRCRMHGGLSTGPKTKEGRKRCREAVLRYWERKRRR